MCMFSWVVRLIGLWKLCYESCNCVCWLKLLFELAWNMLQGCGVSLSDGLNGSLMVVMVVLLLGKVVR